MTTARTTRHRLPQCIVITGKEGSGKDSYGTHLASRGYMHVSAGDVLRAGARATVQ